MFGLLLLVSRADCAGVKVGALQHLQRFGNNPHIFLQSSGLGKALVLGQWDGVQMIGASEPYER
ncbi:MAG TPA: hypothetical protein DDY14_03260 [Chromatiaceae bacterium]|jgi:hypothetical protein|nr:MAG: hypothetical protein N838_13655 [Thiohalocapsa sp. PB-PSB1]QQO53671.1 MAG: hypothetical protein N838_10210 [Thiohalocapsa sp. PB-PSB1]HBG94347.1 hypothetical protein [Chromatiaceae bacterium]